MKKFIKYGIIAGGALILAGAGITTASLLLGADMRDLNGHIRKRLHHLDELDGIVEREADPEEYLVRVDQDPVPEGWETARGDLNGHIRKRLHHLDELDGIVEREADPEEYLVRVDQDPVPEGWETARAEGQDPEAGSSAEPFNGGEPWQSPGTDGGFEAGYPGVTDLKHIRKRLHHLDELDGIVEREADPEEYLVRVDQDPVPEGWETARAEGQDPEAGSSAEPFNGGEPWQSPGTDGGFEAGYPGVTDLKIRQQGGSVEIFRMDEISALTIKSGNGSLEAVSFQEYGMDSVLALRAGDGEDYQIFIPGSWVLDEFEAEILEGTLEGNGVRVLEAELSVREGNAVFTQEDGRSADLECMGSGSILWAMESERYMEIDAECRTGSITISIPETMDPGGIGYDIECENGTVEFPGFTVEGNQKKEAAGSLSVTGRWNSRALQWKEIRRKRRPEVCRSWIWRLDREPFLYSIQRPRKQEPDKRREEHGCEAVV